MKDAAQTIRAGGGLLDCRPFGSRGELQVLLRANITGLPMTFVIKAGVITLDDLRDHLGLPVSLTIRNNVAVHVE